MKTIKISEAKRNFGRIFARAKKGETIILQNGTDFMQLVHYRPTAWGRAFVSAWR